MDLADHTAAPRRRHLVVAGRRTHVTQADLDDYAGLVAKTTWMWFEACALEQDDLRQELWLKVTHALLMYDPARSKMSEKNYVFSLVFNRVKDLLRRAKARRSIPVPHRGGTETQRVQVSSIDYRGAGSDGGALPTDAFEGQHLSIERDDVREVVVAFLPVGLSDLEVRVAVLLALGFEHRDVVAALSCSPRQVKAAARALRVALADRRPPPRDGEVADAPGVVGLAAG